MNGVGSYRRLRTVTARTRPQWQWWGNSHGFEWRYIPRGLGRANGLIAISIAWKMEIAMKALNK